MNTEIGHRSYLWETIKTIVIAVIITLVLMLLAAFLIRTLNIEDKYYDIILQTIKGVSIFISCVLFLRLPNNRWLRGFIIGVLYVVLAFFIFSAMDGEISIGLTFLNDVAIGAVMGMISGIIAKLVRRDRI